MRKGQAVKFYGQDATIVRTGVASTPAYGCWTYAVLRLASGEVRTAYRVEIEV